MFVLFVLHVSGRALKAETHRAMQQDTGGTQLVSVPQTTAALMDDSSMGYIYQDHDMLTNDESKLLSEVKFVNFPVTEL